MAEHDSSRTSSNGVRMRRIFLAVAIAVVTSSLALGQTSRSNTVQATGSRNA